jgi:AcrR family transcriptional regulator
MLSELTSVSQTRPPGRIWNSVPVGRRTIVTWAQKRRLEPLPTKIVSAEAGCGFARPTVYRRYPTREALVEAIMGEAIAEFSGSMEQASSLGGDAAEAIGLLIRSLAEIGAKYPILFQGSDTMHRTPGQASEDADQSRHDTTAIIEQFDVLILRGQREGTVRANLAPEILRHSLLGALSASLKLVRADRPGTGLTAVEVGSQVATILVEGLRPQGQ